MSIWARISDALSALVGGESLSEVFGRLRTPPEQSVGFTIAVIALGAKMAKADGTVTRDEVAAFRRIFHIAPEDEAQAARVYNLARQDVAGFEIYAQKIGGMFQRDPKTLEDLLEGLFHIATADGEYHPKENDFIHVVAQQFGLDDRTFRMLRARFVPDAPPDPYEVLGVRPDTPPDQIRAAWRQLVRDTHPDQMIARGVPEEALKIATERLTAVNRAWEEISAKAH